MVLDRRTVERRLAELDEVLAELEAQEDDGLGPGDLEGDLSRRWSVERGLLAAANLVFDVANHVLAGHFSAHPSTYEESLGLTPLAAVRRTFPRHRAHPLDLAIACRATVAHGPSVLLR